MADEFKPINTQEDFDARVTELYGDVKGLQGQVDTHKNTIVERDQTITQLQKQVKDHETSALKRKIAREKGIPDEMAERLSGEDEKAIRTDAETMAGILRAIKGPAPLFNPEPNGADTQDAALRKMLQEMEGV